MRDADTEVAGEVPFNPFFKTWGYEVALRGTGLGVIATGAIEK